MTLMLLEESDGKIGKNILMKFLMISIKRRSSIEINSTKRVLCDFSN
jgi:hypothetical protein